MEHTTIVLAAIVGLVLGGTAGYTIWQYIEVPSLMNHYENQITDLEDKYENQITNLKNKYENQITSLDSQLSQSQKEVQQLNKSLQYILNYYLISPNEINPKLVSNITEGWELTIDDIGPAHFQSSYSSNESVKPNYYGAGYHLMNKVTPPYSNLGLDFVWSFNIRHAGYYEVYTRWVNDIDRATDAQYIVKYEGGEKSITINQRLKGGTWVRLGTFPFDEGSYSVTVYNSVTGTVVADAIRVVKTDEPFTPPVEDIILDTDQANYIGTWNNGFTTGYYGPGYRANYNGDGSDTATWEINIEHAGLWEVYAWWVEDFNRATNAPYTINAIDSVTVRVDQKQSGTRWVSFGQYEFEEGPASIVLSDDADGYVIADAIKLVYIQPQ